MATENRLPQTTVLQRGVEQPNGVGVVMQRGSFNVRERKSNVDSLTWTMARTGSQCTDKVAVMKNVGLCADFHGQFWLLGFD